MHGSKRRLNTLSIALLAIAVTVSTGRAEEGVVKRWFKAGSNPNGYTIGTEQTDQGRVAYLRSKEDADDEKFGTLMQSFAAEKYVGKRVRFSARVKANGVEGWAGMWMRVDKDNRTSVAFDNMMDRPIKGTTDWANYSIVLDVPSESTSISMGILIGGKGEVYWDDLVVETVGTDVPTTGGPSRNSPLDGPSNLDFEG